LYGWEECKPSGLVSEGKRSRGGGGEYESFFATVLAQKREVTVGGGDVGPDEPEGSKT